MYCSLGIHAGCLIRGLRYEQPLKVHVVPGDKEGEGRGIGLKLRALRKEAEMSSNQKEVGWQESVAAVDPSQSQQSFRS